MKSKSYQFWGLLLISLAIPISLFLVNQNADNRNLATKGQKSANDIKNEQRAADKLAKKAKDAADNAKAKPNSATAITKAAEAAKAATKKADEVQKIVAVATLAKTTYAPTKIALNDEACKKSGSNNSGIRDDSCYASAGTCICGGRNVGGTIAQVAKSTLIPVATVAKPAVVKAPVTVSKPVIAGYYTSDKQCADAHPDQTNCYADGKGGCICGQIGAAAKFAQGWDQQQDTAAKALASGDKKAAVELCKQKGTPAAFCNEMSAQDLISSYLPYFKNTSSTLVDQYNQVNTQTAIANSLINGDKKSAVELCTNSGTPATVCESMSVNNLVSTYLTAYKGDAIKIATGYNQFITAQTKQAADIAQQKPIVDSLLTGNKGSLIDLCKQKQPSGCDSMTISSLISTYLPLYKDSATKISDNFNQVVQLPVAKSAAELLTQYQYGQLATIKPVDYQTEYNSNYSACVSQTRGSATNTCAEIAAAKAQTAVAATTNVSNQSLVDAETQSLIGRCLTLSGSDCSTKAKAIASLAKLVGNPNLTAATIEKNKADVEVENLAYNRIANTLKNLGSYDAAATAVGKKTTTWVQIEQQYKDNLTKGSAQSQQTARDPWNILSTVVPGFNVVNALRTGDATDLFPALKNIISDPTVVAGWNDITAGRFKRGNDTLMSQYANCKDNSITSCDIVPKYDAGTALNGALAQGGDAAMVVTAIVAAPLAPGIGAYLSTGLGVAMVPQMVGMAGDVCQQAKEGKVSQSECDTSRNMAVISAASIPISLASNGLKAARGAQLFSELSAMSKLANVAVKGSAIGVDVLASATFTDMAVKTCNTQGVTQLDCASSVAMALASGGKFLGNAGGAIADLSNTTKSLSGAALTGEKVMSGAHLASAGLFLGSSCSKLADTQNLDTVSMCAFGLSGAVQSGVGFKETLTRGKELVLPPAEAKIATAEQQKTVIDAQLKIAESKLEQLNREPIPDQVKIEAAQRTVEALKVKVTALEPVVPAQKPVAEAPKTPVVEAKKNIVATVLEKLGLGPKIEKNIVIAEELIPIQKAVEDAKNAPFWTRDKAQKVIIAEADLARAKTNLEIKAQDASIIASQKSVNPKMTEAIKNGEINVGIDSQAIDRVKSINDQFKPPVEEAFRLKTPDNATAELKNEINNLNKIFDSFEAESGYHLRQDQILSVLSDKAILQLNAGAGKSTVIGPLLAAIERRVIVTLATPADAANYVNDTASKIGFYEKQGIKVVYFDNNRGFLEISGGFKVSEAKVIPAETVRGWANEAAVDNGKGLLVISVSADNAFATVSGKEISAPLTSRLINEMNLGDRNFLLVVDEIGAVADGSFSVSKGEKIQISQLTAPKDLSGMRSAKELIKATQEVQKSNTLSQFRDQVLSKLKSGQNTSDLFFTYTDANGIKTTKPYPADMSVIGNSYKEVLNQNLKNNRLSSNSSLRTEMESIVKALETNPSNESARKQFESLMKRPGTSNAEISALGDLNYRVADLQARWKTLSRVPTNEFGLETEAAISKDLTRINNELRNDPNNANLLKQRVKLESTLAGEIVLRTSGGTSGQTYSQTVDRIALQSEGSAMMKAVGHDISGVISIDKLTITSDSNQIRNKEIFEAKAASGKLKGVDATPDTAANFLGIDATAKSERPIDPSNLVVKNGSGEVITEGIKQMTDSGALKGKALAVVIGDESVGFDQATNNIVKSRTGTETLARIKYITDPNGSAREEYYIEKISKNADGSINREIIERPESQKAWSDKIQSLLDNPEKLAIVYEGRTRAVDLAVTENNKNIEWASLAGKSRDISGNLSETNMETITQMWKRNRVPAKAAELKALGWTDAEIAEASKYTLWVNSDNTSLTKNNVIDHYNAVLQEQLASVQIENTIKSVTSQTDQALQKIATSLESKYPGIKTEIESMRSDVQRVAKAQIMEIQTKPLTGDQIPQEIWQRGQEAFNLAEAKAKQLETKYKLSQNEISTVRSELGVDSPYISQADFMDTFRQQNGKSAITNPTNITDIALNWAKNNNPDTIPNSVWHNNSEEINTGAQAPTESVITQTIPKNPVQQAIANISSWFKSLFPKSSTPITTQPVVVAPVVLPIVQPISDPVKKAYNEAIIEASNKGIANIPSRYKTAAGVQQWVNIITNARAKAIKANVEQDVSTIDDLTVLNNLTATAVALEKTKVTAAIARATFNNIKVPAGVQQQGSSAINDFIDKTKADQQKIAEEKVVEKPVPQATPGLSQSLDEATRLAKAEKEKQRVINATADEKNARQLAENNGQVEPFSAGQSDISKLAQYLTGINMDSDENAIKLVQFVQNSQKAILSELGIPNPELRKTSPQEYRDALMAIAKKYNVPIKSSQDVPPQYLSEFGNKNFYDDEWGTETIYVKDPASLDPTQVQILAHELVHAIDYIIHPELPVEFKEYRAYIAEYKLTTLITAEGKADRNLLEYIFGGMSIMGSSHFYNFHNDLEDIWKNNTVALTPLLQQSRSLISRNQVNQDQSNNNSISKDDLIEQSLETAFKSLKSNPLAVNGNLKIYQTGSATHAYTPEANIETAITNTPDPLGTFNRLETSQSLSEAVQTIKAIFSENNIEIVENPLDDKYKLFVNQNSFNKEITAPNSSLGNYYGDGIMRLNDDNGNEFGFITNTSKIKHYIFLHPQFNTLPLATQLKTLTHEFGHFVEENKLPGKSELVGGEEGIVRPTTEYISTLYGAKAALVAIKFGGNMKDSGLIGQINLNDNVLGHPNNYLSTNVSDTQNINSKQPQPSPAKPDTNSSNASQSSNGFVDWLKQFTSSAPKSAYAPISPQLSDQSILNFLGKSGLTARRSFAQSLSPEEQYSTDLIGPRWGDVLVVAVRQISNPSAQKSQLESMIPGDSKTKSMLASKIISAVGKVWLPDTADTLLGQKPPIQVISKSSMGSGTVMGQDYAVPRHSYQIQDVVGVASLNIPNGTANISIVADGVSGGSLSSQDKSYAQAVAQLSKTIVQSVKDSLNSNPPTRLPQLIADYLANKISFTQYSNDIVDYFANLDSVAGKFNRNRVDTVATTLNIVIHNLQTNRLLVHSLGDSPVLILRGDKVAIISANKKYKGNTLSTIYKPQSSFTPTKINENKFEMQGKDAKPLSLSGGNNNHNAFVIEYQLEPGDIVINTTDGLFKQFSTTDDDINWSNIAQLLNQRQSDLSSYESNIINQAIRAKNQALPEDDLAVVAHTIGGSPATASQNKSRLIGSGPAQWGEDFANATIYKWWPETRTRGTIPVFFDWVAGFFKKPLLPVTNISQSPIQPQNTVKSLDLTIGSISFLDQIREKANSQVGSRAQEVEQMAINITNELHDRTLNSRQQTEILSDIDQGTKDLTDIIDFLTDKKLLVLTPGDDAQQVAAIMNYLLSREKSVDKLRPFFEQSVSGIDEMVSRFTNLTVSDPGEFNPMYAKVLLIDLASLGEDPNIYGFYEKKYGIFIINDTNDLVTSKDLTQWRIDHETNHQLGQNDLTRGQIKNAISSSTLPKNVKWYTFILEGHNELLTYYTQQARALKNNQNAAGILIEDDTYRIAFDVFDIKVRQTLLAKGYTNIQAINLMLALGPKGFQPLVDALGGWDIFLGYFEQRQQDALSLGVNIVKTEPNTQSAQLTQALIRPTNPVVSIFNRISQFGQSFSQIIIKPFNSLRNTFTQKPETPITPATKLPKPTQEPQQTKTINFTDNDGVYLTISGNNQLEISVNKPTNPVAKLFAIKDEFGRIEYRLAAFTNQQLQTDQALITNKDGIITTLIVSPDESFSLYDFTLTARSVGDNLHEIFIEPKKATDLGEKILNGMTTRKQFGVSTWKELLSFANKYPNFMMYFVDDLLSRYGKPNFLPENFKTMQSSEKLSWLFGHKDALTDDGYLELSNKKLSGSNLGQKTLILDEVKKYAPQLFEALKKWSDLEGNISYTFQLNILSDGQILWQARSTDGKMYVLRVKTTKLSDQDISNRLVSYPPASFLSLNRSG